jgi:ABC-type transport system involved in multi-copper enzyme maturation permease subunit
MVGAVFALESMRAGRRMRGHVLRWICGGWLLLQFIVAYSDYLDRDNGTGNASLLASFAVSHLDLILVQQFLIVALLTPALVAGTITEEKTRGTLETLLTTEISPLAIIVGKLLARMADVAMLTLVVLPMAAFVGPYAGASVSFLLGQAVVTILTAFGLSCLSLLASVWTRQTRAAIFSVYLVVLAAAGLYWGGWISLPNWARWLDPIWVLTPARDGSPTPEFVRRLVQSIIAWLALGSICIAIAAWRLRPAYARQRGAKQSWIYRLRTMVRPEPAWNPVAWKERYVGARLPRWLPHALIAIVTIWTVVRQLNAPAAVVAGIPVSPVEVLISNGWYAIGLLTLFVAVQASGAISGERERLTWNELLMTPMSFRDLLQGKLRGILAGAWPYLITYLLASAAATAVWSQHSMDYLLIYGLISTGLALAARFVSPRLGRLAFAFLALAWGLMSDISVALTLAVTLVTAWLAMEFFASVGLWCSVRCSSSWRSLMMTAGLGYIGGLVLSCVSTPLALSTGIVLYLVTRLIEVGLELVAHFDPAWAAQSDFAEALLPLFFAVGVALMYWWAARSLVFAAENYLAANERIPTGRARLFDVERAATFRRDAESSERSAPLRRLRVAAKR